MQGKGNQQKKALTSEGEDAHPVEKETRMTDVPTTTKCASYASGYCFLLCLWGRAEEVVQRLPHAIHHRTAHHHYTHTTSPHTQPHAQRLRVDVQVGALEASPPSGFRRAAAAAAAASSFSTEEPHHHHTIMPTISLVRDDLFTALGKTYTDDEFQDLCFDFGIELDEITTEAELASKEGSSSKGKDGAEGGAVIYKIDVPANRYDILCMEGLSRALRIFLELEEAPVYRKVEPTGNGGGRTTMTVEASTAAIRPVVVCAILRDVAFDPLVYKSFIDLQEHLHRNICRRRTLVAIGTHDLDTLQGPFTYKAAEPTSIQFSPLTSEDGRVFNGKELLDSYRTDESAKHLKPYTDIIYDAPLYPVLYDSQGIVLSLPPIINGRHSRITLQTRNVLIECTATDRTKANIVLDTVVTMFSQHCALPFTVESVDVIYEGEDRRVETTPLLSSRQVAAKMSDIESLVGRELGAELVCTLCNKMQLGPASYDGATDSVVVTVPPTRSDVMHAVDVIEDVAIAYGYNNLPIKVPATLTVGKPLPINAFADLLRDEVSRAGYLEVLTHGLCSRAENFTKLRRPDARAVSLSNPANEEYEIVRTTLLPGLLKVLQHNRAVQVKEGLRFFEISDVVLRDEETDVGARNVRRLVASYTCMTAGFESIHGLVDRVMLLVQVGPTEAYAGNSMRGEERMAVLKEGMQYYIKQSEDPAFFPGRCADVMLVRKGEEGKPVRIGTFGVLHPEVLKAYDIPFPTSALEMDLEPLM